MSYQDHYAPHSQFGIDEVYFHKGFECDLTEKLQQRAILSLDLEDSIVQKYISLDMILIFKNKVPSTNLVYKFLKHLSQQNDKEDFIKSNTLLNEDEIFEAIKSKIFILVTPKILSKAIYIPN